MSALVAITLGNSRAAAALAVDGSLGPVCRAPVEQLDDLRDLLARACPDCGGDPATVAVASVNPAALERLGRLAAEMVLPPPLVARADFPIPMTVDVDEPDGVGVDRILGALAAHRRTRGACITVDCGTAITVNAVSAAGAFVGGAIFPGLAMMARALREGTAQLPEIALDSRPPALGGTTEQAIAAGVLRGAAAAVADLVAGARRTIGAEAPVILTGGDAGRLAPLLGADGRRVEENLVLEGLVIACREWPKR